MASWIRSSSTYCYWNTNGICNSSCSNNYIRNYVAQYPQCNFPFPSLRMIFMNPILLQTTSQILNGSAYNLSNVTSLFTYTNNATGGLEGMFLMIILFLVITVGLSFRYKIINALIGGAVLCLIFSLLLQQIGILSVNTPILFIGILILGISIELLSGFTRPYGSEYNKTKAEPISFYTYLYIIH